MLLLEDLVQFTRVVALLCLAQDTWKDPSACLIADMTQAAYFANHMCLQSLWNIQGLDEYAIASSLWKC